MYEPDIEMMELSDIRKLQSERFVKMVRYAYDNVPMYKEKFEKAGITPDDIKGLEDAHKMPFTVKDDLRQHYPYGIRAVELDKIVRLHASSGTTGKPTVVTYTEQDMETWNNLMARCYASAGVTKGDIVQNCYGYGLFTGGLGFHYGAERLGATVIPISTGNTKKQLMMMKDMQSTVIACTPSYALYLAEAAEKEGYDPKKDFNIKVGMFGAEPWSEEARKRIEDSLGIKAYDVFGMSELYGPGVAVECQEQAGLHIWSDEFLVETIDPDTGEVLPEGERGELVFTMLTREAMPLLRYRTKDLAIINYDKCKCGRSHPRIMRIRGRSDDMLIIGGVNVFPSQIEHVLMNIEGVGDQYLIIVDRDVLDSLHVQVEVMPEFFNSPEYDPAAFAKKLETEMQAILTVRARVELMVPGALPRSEGKAVRVQDKRKNASK
ncbi:MAG: phenylacetate--CoA ligase [Thermoplasmata archaeon]|nr:phenylacetate--CoA ligase [Thermoplasmata archaeon]